MIYTVTSWVFLALALAICIVFNHPKLKEHNCFSMKTHIIFCVVVFVIGCLVRLVALGSLPYGPSAEEALVAVQGKTLWQTGHFFNINHFTTQFQYWEGESAGPFLAVITAPFVGLLGINPWTARLPLAILSILAMIAMYGVGKELGGERAGRYALLVEALCPYFVLSTRLTASANAALYLLPIVFYAVLRGTKKTIWQYLGMILMAVLAYTQDMYFFIAPLLLIVIVIISLIKRRPVIHTVLSGMIGLIIVFPAVLTAVVNLTGKDGFVLLDSLEIPKLISFDKADWLGPKLLGNIYAYNVFISQLWGAVISGSIFQYVAHENISRMIIEPDGFYALYTISFPLMLLGLFSLLKYYVTRKKDITTKIDINTIRNLEIPLAGGIITAFIILFFGSVGRADFSGTTYCYDYSSMFFYDALLMVAGFARIDRKSRIGTVSVISLMGINFILLCVFLFGTEYRENCNVNFFDFKEAVIEAHEIQEKTNADIYLTDEVFPHRNPDEAAEFMYLYSINADMHESEKKYSVFYPPVIEQPDEGVIHVVYSRDTTNWDLERFDYQEFGRYALLTPIVDDNETGRDK